MNNKIDVSIIVPLYNRESTIARLLTKIAEQDYNLDKIEVIISDDKSTDNSLKVVEQFKSLIPNLIILESNMNSGGASVPRNKALDNANGEWVLFIDSDDYITPYSISDAMEIANTTNNDMICMPYFRAINSNRPISRSAFSCKYTKSDLIFENTKLYNSLNVIGKFIKRSIIEDYNIRFPKDIKVREDNWFLMQVYSVVNYITILGYEKDYYFYEAQDDVALSNSSTPPRDAVKIYSAVYDFIVNQNNISQQRKQDLLTIFLNRYVDMIQRGQYAPMRLFKHTKKTLIKLLRNPFISEKSITFIENLFLGKYDKYQ
ncbi:MULTISPECIES: glycosyltransferase family 2 protein [Staphylococcus]|nr:MULTISPECIES: glycosyltransferase family 2 protein [Staphylococcus]MBL3398547.1 glycosyltransferase family 2 protein [Staphylococcus pasteuri]MBM6506447.1 glycosyltransferase family 2 protein [Staphylococcus pasteuri]PTU81150.1 glycosyltransferase family 2 protein [Staphylococcus pasteuri]PTU85925.1 glycosyltransferase family 2 protein [Staphylococcus pasteuri]QQT10611.1 glycosyltransferase family 2 protein [Staphylococcus pasteuri]